MTDNSTKTTSSSDSTTSLPAQEVPKEPTYLQKYERSMFEMRLKYPIAFNMTMVNTLFGTYVMSGLLRRRSKAFTPLGTSVTLVSSTLFILAYARAYSTKFLTTWALPVRGEIVGEDLAAKENLKLQQAKRKEATALFVTDSKRKLNELRKEFDQELSKEQQERQQQQQDDKTTRL